MYKDGNKHLSFKQTCRILFLNIYNTKCQGLNTTYNLKKETFITLSVLYTSLYVIKYINTETLTVLMTFSTNTVKST